ncbi:MAG: T9SS type A sorting domain-containing protein [Saprospiraceae bacterium]|jgi:hypothetical protein
MQKFIYTILFCSLLFSTISYSQERYLNQVFAEVEVSSPVPVASNYTIMPWLFAALQQKQGHTAVQPLVAQFYTPKGDTATNRPLIIYLHTGNFMPYEINGACGGTMRDSSNVEIASRLAKMGYVVAVVNYRQGWNPLHSVELVRRYFLINAAYRGVQDVNTYIRYFKMSVDKLNNVHGIDPDKITVWGQGTGGYLSLATSYLKSYPEIFNTADPFKFILPTAAGNVPMVLEPYNNNIGCTNAITTVDATYNALSTLPIGDTLSKPNHVGYDSNFALAVNMGGALGDSTWMNQGEVPLISYHVVSDAYAPCETDVLNVPTLTGPQPVVEVSGSCDMQAKAARYGNNDYFNDIYPSMDPYGNLSKSSLHGFFPFYGTPNDSGSPWEWSFADKPKPTTDPNTSGCNTNASTAKMYIDTIVGFFAPRACIALNLPCKSSVTSSKDVNDAQVDLRIAPNPATTEFQISTSSEAPIQSYAIYDISGRMVRNVNSVNTNQITVKRESLQNGLYIIRMQFDQGIISKKILFE